MADTYLSQIALFACGFVPTGFMACQGQSLPVEQYSALYSLLGNRYGGTDTTFNLPKLAFDQDPIDLVYAICVQGLFPQRPESEEGATKLKG